MAVIHIDGKSFEVEKSENLLQVCLSLGIDIPYFCYHPALGAVGSCRQCAVKQYNSEDDYRAGRGRLVMSCMVPTTDNLYISVDDDEAKTFRKRIVEYLMTNHPHDCPTCEEGGHCHLQDMTYMSGHRQRRYRFTKRTHHNQELGAFINHEMNRCIACYRCVRFYKDYAGGSDFGVYASNNRVYFGRETDGQFESEFSGNLTEVCPTGVFTDKTHSDRYNRKWDMQYAPSICHGCSAGCNISAGERYGELRRIENRYNHDVNGYFLCDKGRFGYGYVNRADRPLQPLENIDGKLIKINAEYALDGVVEVLSGKSVIGIGSPTASLESNFALKRLVGADNFSTGERLHNQKLTHACVELLRHELVHNVSLAQIEQADAVLVLGEDITQTSSRVALSLRQAAKNKQKQMAAALRTETWLAEPVRRIGQEAYSPIYLASVNDTKLSDIAKQSVVASIDDIARLGFLVGEVIANFADDLDDIEQSEQAFFAKEATGELVQDDELMVNLAHHIAYDLIMADRPLVVSGTGLSSPNVIAATGFIAQELTKKRSKIKQFAKTCHDIEQSKIRANADTPSHDADKLNRPENDGTPANVKLEAQVVRTPNKKDHACEQMYSDKTGVYMVLPHSNSVGVDLLGGKSLEEVLALPFDAVIVMENDLSALSQEQQNDLCDKTLIVLDHQSYDWHGGADFVLSAASFAEGDGTVVSAEGRAGRFFAAYDKKYYLPLSDIKDSWRWLGAIYHELHQNNGTTWQHLDEVIDDLIADNDHLALIKDVAPASNYRITGLKIAREPRRYSGRTAQRAKISVHEPMQPKDTDTALTFSMEGYVGEQTPASSIPFAWSAGWNSPQAWNKYQDKVGGKLKGGDVGVRLFDSLPKSQTVYDSVAVVCIAPSSIFNEQAKLVPIYQLFSSSALVSASPVVAKQIAPATWLIDEDDAKRWQLQIGDLLTISQNGQSVTLPVMIADYVAQGCIGYPFGQVPLVPHLPAVVKKVSQADIYVPMYLHRLHALQGLTAPSLSAFNIQSGKSHVEVLA